MGAVALVLAAAAGAVEEPITREYQIKAAFLYNFLKYVEWPEGRLPRPDSPLVIGTYCPEAFAEVLEKIVTNRSIDGRRVHARRLATAAEAGTVHVVFVCAGREETWGAVAPVLGDAAVLTVADSGSPAARKAVIAFELRGDKVRFSISAHRAALARLRISDQLQKLAVFVRQGP